MYKLLPIVACFGGLLLESSLAFGVSDGVFIRRAPSTITIGQHDGAFARVSSPRVGIGAVLLSSSTSSADEVEQEEKLTLDKVAELIDTTFVNGCMQLAKGYVDVLKLLIVSIKSGYEMGVTPSDLIDKVEAVVDQAAGRPLMAEEVRLRNAWIHVVYLVLSQADHVTADDTIKEAIEGSIASTYAAKIPILKRRQDSGEEFRFDDLLDSDASADNPVENAIMTQSLRVIWLSLVVLEEEERCNTEFARQDAPAPMKPQIPGTYE